MRPRPIERVFLIIFRHSVILSGFGRPELSGIHDVHVSRHHQLEKNPADVKRFPGAEPLQRCPCPRGSRQLSGTQGAGKSTTSALLQQLLQPAQVVDAEKISECSDTLRTSFPDNV